MDLRIIKQALGVLFKLKKKIPTFFFIITFDILSLRTVLHGTNPIFVFQSF